MTVTPEEDFLVSTAQETLMYLACSTICVSLAEVVAALAPEPRR